ncbi:DUF6538 domain-containing protein [Piscinibacterium candidicorallinum]|uniref:DUF6538 domain-containing protein n=2 Tax=Piscinibacterium candidicorallinum TaxID=1793872 RepID=A0ABV7H621_9BURK
MAKETGLYQREGVFYVRVMVPKPLHDVLGAKEYRESLHTRDRSEAKARAAAIRAAKLAQFETLRRNRKLTPLDALKPEQVEALAAAVRRDVLKFDDLIRIEAPSTWGASWTAALAGGKAGAIGKLLPLDTTAQDVLDLLDSSEHPLDTPADWDPLAGLTPVQREVAAGYHGRLLTEAQAAVAGDLSKVRARADHAARLLGWQVDWAANRSALQAIAGSLHAAASDLLRRNRGEPVETPAAPQQASPSVAKLRDVFGLWEGAELKRPRNTVEKYRRSLELFEEFTGNAPLASLRTAQGFEFSTWLRSKFDSPKTANDRLTAVKTLLNFAAQRLELIPRNPWQGVSIATSKRAVRRPWTVEELETLFAAPLFTDFRLPDSTKAGGEAAYWLPILGLFTGARLSELCQLRTVDFERADSATEAGSIPLLRITEAPDPEEEDDAPRSLKTDAAQRIVPLHPELIRLGFLDYCAARKAAGDSRLFPDVRSPESDTAGKYVSEWFGKFRKARGLSRRYLDFHALRHTVRTRLVDAHAPEPTIDALLGHEGGGSTGRRVYTHASPSALRDAIQRLSYPGLNLPRVYPQPAAA